MKRRRAQIGPGNDGVNLRGQKGVRDHRPRHSQGKSLSHRKGIDIPMDGLPVPEGRRYHSIRLPVGANRP